MTTPDLDAIQREYRAGQLSNRELGRQQGVSEAAIRKWAKQYGWTRNLSAAVRARVREELVRDAVRANGCELMGVEPSDAATVNEAAARGVQVVRVHRRDIDALRQAVAALLSEIQHNHRPPEGDDPTQDGPPEGVPEWVPIKISERSRVIADLSQTYARLIPLERQAFALDEGPSEEKTYEERLRALCSG